MIRKAKAVWRGTGRDGNGDLSTDSGVLDKTPYSFKTRFENEKGSKRLCLFEKSIDLRNCLLVSPLSLGGTVEPSPRDDQQQEQEKRDGRDDG